MENQINKKSEPLSLTVVVLDSGSKPTEGARVSITPSDASGVTNGKGEVVFILVNETRYDITASSGKKTVTVPYYVTPNGATRLVINPTYVRTIEKQLHPYDFSNISTPVYIALSVLVVIIITGVLIKIIRKKRKPYKKQMV